MSFLHRAVLFTSLCSCFLAASAQEPCTLTLSGQILDEHDRSPLSFAEIFLPDLGKGTVADEQGGYVITGLCPGVFNVRVVHLGCEPVERRIELDRDLQMNFWLEHHSEELRELEVIREKPDENVGHARSELDGAAMERVTGRDISSMLAQIPGVNVVKTGPVISKPMIHGLSGNRVLILNQGIRQEDQQWGTEHAPNIDPFSTDRVTVIKGAAAVQYGSDAMGGVVIMEPVLSRSRQDVPLARVLASGTSNGRGGMLAGEMNGISRNKRINWRIQGSSRVLGDSHAASYVLSNTGLREAAGSAALGWVSRSTEVELYYSAFARETGILRAAHIGNLTDLQDAIQRERPWYVAPFTYSIAAPRQTSLHHLFKTEVRQRISDRDQLVFTYGYQRNTRQEFDIRRGEASDLPALDILMPTHSGDLVLKHWIGSKLHGKVGLNGIYQTNVNIPGTGIRPLIPNFKKTTLGGFILEHFPLSNDLELEAGVRLEMSSLDVFKYDMAGEWITPEHDFLNNAVSVGANWAINDRVRLRLNANTAYRPPHVSELYSEGVHHGSGSIERGDPSLSNERSMKFVADLSGNFFKERLVIDVTGYHDRIANYIYLRPAGYMLTIRGAFPVFDHTVTDATLTGLDAMAEIRIVRDLYFRSRASMVRGYDLTGSAPLFLMPSDRMDNAIIHRRKAWGQWKDINLELVSVAVLRQSRSPLGVDLTDPPEGYHLIDANLSMSRPLGSNEISIGISGNNLFNVEYRDILDRSRYFAAARGREVSIRIIYAFKRTK